MIDTDESAPSWRRVPVQPVDENASCRYRGFALTADTYGWTVAARWGGYSVMASSHAYSDDRPSIDANMAAAVAATDDLITKGWEPR